MYACGEISKRLKTAVMRVIFVWNLIIFKKVLDFFFNLHFCHCSTKVGQDDYKVFALSVVRKVISVIFLISWVFFFLFTGQHVNKIFKS